MPTKSVFSGIDYESVLKKALEKLNLMEDQVEVRVIEKKKALFLKNHQSN